MNQSRRIEVRQLSKTFTLHMQGGLHMPIFSGVDMDVDAGECVVIHAPSGAGKSTLLRCLYANYRASSGSVKIRHAAQNGEALEWVDLVSASPQQVHAVRNGTLGFVTQFLRVIPRISTLDLVAEPLINQGMDAGAAQESDRLLRGLGLLFSRGRQIRDKRQMDITDVVPADVAAELPYGL